MKTLQELTGVGESCWLDVEQMLKEAANKVVVLPKSNEQAENTVVQLQLSTQTWLGAIVYETGGILVDNGWIRILGSGCEQLTRSIADWNFGKAYDSYDEDFSFLLVADDVLGGFYAINFGELGNDIGSVYYFAPDSLEWEPMDMEYGQLLWFFFSGDLSGFYEDYRWKKWRDELATLSPDEAYHIYPPLYSEEFVAIDKTERTAIPVEELYEQQMEAAEAFFDDNDE